MRFAERMGIENHAVYVECDSQGGDVDAVKMKGGVESRKQPPNQFQETARKPKRGGMAIVAKIKYLSHNHNLYYTLQPLRFATGIQ